VNEAVDTAIAEIVRRGYFVRRVQPHHPKITTDTFEVVTPNGSIYGFGSDLMLFLGEGLVPEMDLAEEVA
jgi:hypothetical protein